MKIRCASPDDTKRLLEIYAYYVTNTASSFEYDVPSEAEFCSRILNTLYGRPHLIRLHAPQLRIDHSVPASV
ncbi:MAG: GNAT family N-acetyltransferase [Oscillospiraceae bacterium]|nr:GNAT family N-acetyltransferase [Oscillospiraceae bacterium]